MNIIEPIEEQKKLTAEQEKKLALQIAENFHQWDEDRSAQVAVAKKIMTEVYLNQPKRSKVKGLEWESDIKLNAVYNIKKTKKSVMWREMWANPSNMFDVQGTSEETEQNSKAQKAAIVDSLKKMDVGKAFDEGIDNLYDIGEIIFKTDWEKRSKTVKRQIANKGFILQNLVRLVGQSGYFEHKQQMEEIELPYYENARVESVSPFMFVFDHSKWDFKQESWKKLIKISKRFEDLNDLRANKNYKITAEMVEDLKDKADKETGHNKDLSGLRDENKHGGKYSVLYAHGDFKIDGKLYKNYIAEVLAGKYLIRFEENPLWICPFIICALEYDPATKRGISPLKSVYELCQKEEELFNTACNVQKLTANPCYWANEDLFDKGNTDKDGNIAQAPGRVLKVKNNYDGSLPQRIDVSAGGISDLLSFLNNQISEVSSVSDVMFGNIESAKRTATELSLADKGSSSQASKELDTIYQNLTIPMIENVAELLAMFKSGNEVIFYEDKGKKVELQITNAIRQAQYNYYYEDRNALIERKQRFSDLFNLFKEVGANDILFSMINWREVITQAVEMIGIDNSDKFFKPETPISQMLTQLEQMPEPMQQQLAPVIQQAIQVFMQNMQMQQMQQQAQQLPVNGGV